jgi:molybdopterin/thiamine biosynthesis adenylyltransferase
MSLQTMTDRERYARLEEMPAIGARGLEALRSKTVTVLGAGNIGGQLAQHLVLLGITVVLVDRDVVTEANLGTQSFTEDQLGRSKAKARAERLAPLNPSCRIEPIHADIRHLGLGALRDTTVLCSCLDSRSSRLLGNEIAVRHGVPWVDGALDGSGRTLLARVACYDPRAAESACYLCPHDAASLRAMSTEATPRTGCAAMWWKEAHDAATPSLAFSALGGAVASMQALWSLKLLLNQADDIAATEMYFDLGRRQLSTHRLVRNPRCLLDHRTWTLVPLPEGSYYETVDATFRFAEQALGTDVSLQAPRRVIATRLKCPGCGSETFPCRALDAIEAFEPVCACGVEMHPAAAGLIGRFGRAEAGPFLDRTWAEIGLPPAEVVVATGGGRQLHMLLSDVPE